MEEKKKWTVFFLMHAEDFHEQAVATIRSILATEKNEQVAVIFCLNINTENLPLDFETEEPRPPNRATTLFYVIGRDKKGKNILVFLAESKDFRFDNPQSIRDFFSDKVLRTNSAEKFLLITWDHGQPFAIFPSEDSSVQRSDLSPTHGNMLTIGELRQAIESAFAGEKIDVVVMFNCYLQYFDTGFELSSCVHYLVAFEMHMFFEDYLDYSNIFKTLSANPSIEPRALAKLFVSTFSHSRDPGDATKNQVVFSAHDLSVYPEMATLIDELAGALIQLLPGQLERIRGALKKCRYLTNAVPKYRLIDFNNIIRQLHSEIPEAFPRELYTRLNRRLDEIVLESYIGSDYKDEHEPPFYSPKSFSIYFPDSLTSAATDFYRVFVNRQSSDAPRFAKGFRWVTFIEKFVNEGI